ncbi:hypothetical protein [Streptococcus halichoeri]|uniref:hypothetical protein n=1 Tax=Streptococcus halichoeri TaxID=254785 RepID=UPI00135AAECF|nr:hypothetical protein [Streptococcus halichoeri]
MAKGHWGKKAVLASLIVSAGLLSGQETVWGDNVEENKQKAAVFQTKLGELKEKVSTLERESPSIILAAASPGSGFEQKFSKILKQLEDITHDEQVWTNVK